MNNGGDINIKKGTIVESQQIKEQQIELQEIEQ